MKTSADTHADDDPLGPIRPRLSAPDWDRRKAELAPAEAAGTVAAVGMRYCRECGAITRHERRLVRLPTGKWARLPWACRACDSKPLPPRASGRAPAQGKGRPESSN